MSSDAGKDDVVSLNRSYEHWLKRQFPLVGRDLRKKQKKLAESAFVFLRGSFHIWANRFPGKCPELTNAPHVLSVGDLHVENFGTWRDAEGRLVFGINDFDDAYALPYANDLVRLATSAFLAAEKSWLATDRDEVCRELLAGYRRALATGGDPLILNQRRRWLAQLVRERLALRDAPKFWECIDEDLRKGKGKPKNRDGMRHAVAALPKPHPELHVVARSAGVGSLGKPRVMAVAEPPGGRVVREAKRLSASACVWAAKPDGKTAERSQVRAILSRAVRSTDPVVHVTEGWIVRRLAPDCDKVSLSTKKGDRQGDLRLLRTMGWEVANVHLGTPRQTRAIRDDLAARPTGWLLKAASAMCDSVEKDWRAWRKHYRATNKSD